MARNRFKSRGFTLLELMVTIAIFSIIAAAMFMVLASGRNSWLSGTTYAQVQQEIRKSKEWIGKELCQGRNSTVGMPDSYLVGNMIHSSRIIFQVPLSVSDSGSVSWQTVEYYPSGLNNKQLLRNVNGEIKVIANDIDSIDFAREKDKPLLVYIAVAASRQDVKGRAISSTLNFKLKFRN